MSRRNPRFMRILAVPALACMILLPACGGGSAADSATASQFLAGNWEFMLTQNSPPSPTPVVKKESGFLVQSGTAISGGVILTGAALCPGLGSAQGTVSGAAVTLTVNQIAQTVNLTGTVSSDGSISGDYSIFASGCGNGSTTGTFTGSQVKPVTGTYQATFSSGYSGVSVYNYTVAVKQGPNTGASNALLSGTMMSTNSPCAGNLSIAGLIGGTSVVFNLLASDGTAVGQFRGSTSADAKTLTGTYDFLAEKNGCSGDAGGVTMTLQSSQ
jgi:hypothetical protein